MSYLTILGILFIFFILFNKLLIKNKYFLDPNKNLVHKSFLNQRNDVPFSGGILILISCLIFLSSEYNILKIFLILISGVGILSDLEILKSPSKRIAFQTLIIGIFLIISGTLIESIRIEILESLFEIYQFKLVFTIFCLLILINGTNFLDGLNTLVTVYYIMVIFCILYLKYRHNFDLNLDVLKVVLPALIVFLFFNFFGKAYLGDNGSYLISFVVGVVLIEISNKNFLDLSTSQEFSPYFIACLLWYPAYENLFSIIRKKLKKISPIEPDNNHLHQLIYLKLRKKLKIKNEVLNTLAGIIINTYNLFIFFICVNNYTNTKLLVLVLGINALVYTSLYAVLNKGSIAQ